MLCAVLLFAQQKNTPNTVPVQIVSTKNFYSVATDSGAINKFIGEVQFQQGTDMLFCDSAFLNQEKNNVEAFGNVRIVQSNGTQVMSDYLRYTGNLKQAFLRGNVSLTNGSDNLWTEELNYNLGTKIGTYSQGGTLQNGTTTVSSVNGTYDAKAKEARFIQDVYVTDTQYSIESKDLGYNSESKMMRFFDSSVVVNNTTVLRTVRGTYDSKNEIARFDTRSSVYSTEQYMEADTMHYNRFTGLGNALGNVVILDTQQHTTLFCGRAFYNQYRRTMLATDKPVLKRQQGNDSLFIRADTFFSAHVRMLRLDDTTRVDTVVKAEAPKSKKKAKIKVATEEVLPLQPTTSADTTSPKYYTGFHHVRIFSDSLQGVCDSIIFSTEDSVMRMMKGPIVWTRESQLTGEVILVYTDSNTIKKIFIPNDAFIAARSGPEKAQLYDQVQGKTLTAFVSNNQLTYAIVKPAAESIFYPTDDSKAYLGVSEAQSERMKIFFDDGKIDRILLEQEITETMTPLQKADLPSMRLSRFKWWQQLRPRSVEELFE
jgi:lipopolysaccharide export system protein LptA